MQERNNSIKYKELMSITDKDNIVLRFDTTNDVLSVVFLFCQERYIAIVTYKAERIRNVDVDLGSTIGDYLRSDLIDPSKINAAYRINKLDGSIEFLYKREVVSISLSEIEEKLGIAPGCLKIDK